MTDFQHSFRIDEQGIELIRSFEGLRLTAYQDATGIWTIGYGHTSSAGDPQVNRGLTISQEDAEKILQRDVAQFAQGVARLITIKLNEAQFACLVSFAYNVGLDAFARSGVLKAVNARDFEAVPRRLALWTKAGGKTLPGLVRRRAAEAALFMAGDSQPINRRIVPQQGKPLRQSKTVWSALAIIFIALVNALELAAPWVFAALAIAAAIVIIHQRLQKIKQEGI
jgi:lysozyme